MSYVLPCCAASGQLDIEAKSCYLYDFRNLGVKIHLPAYGQGVHEISEELDASELELDPEAFTQPVQARLRLDRHDPYFDFRIQLETFAKTECDRCLSQIEIPLEVSSPLLFVAGYPPKGDNVDDEDIVYFRPGTTEINLSHDLRDLLILAFSGKHLCHEDCLGLCVQCGANLNDGPCTCNA